MNELRIAVLGAGNIGGTLGRKWAAAGHKVSFGVTNPDSERAQALRAELGTRVTIGSVTDALTDNDVVVTAIPEPNPTFVIGTGLCLLAVLTRRLVHR